MESKDRAFGTPPCTYHRWERYAFANYADIWRCAKCRALVETATGAQPPAAARQPKA